MVAGARFCDAVIGQSLETAHRQVAAWGRRDGVPSRDFERRAPKNLGYFGGQPQVECQTAAVLRAPDCRAHVWLAPTDRAPPASPSAGDCLPTSHTPRGTTRSAASLLAHRHPPCPISPAGS